LKNPEKERKVTGENQTKGENGNRQRHETPVSRARNGSGGEKIERPDRGKDWFSSRRPGKVAPSSQKKEVD